MLEMIPDEWRRLMHRIISIVAIGLIFTTSASFAQESENDSTGVAADAEGVEAQSAPLSATQLELENEKLLAEIANLRIENRALGVGTRKTVAILGAIGGLTGALLTFFIGFAGYKLSRVQNERLRKDKEHEDRRLTQDRELENGRLRQDRELAREMQNLELFRDLGSENPRTQIAAASLLLQRLKAHGATAVDKEIEKQERPTIIKVLVSVLKEKRESQGVGFDTLRKYIADNLVEILGSEIRDYDWQNVNLSNVWWPKVDASNMDFYQANLREAGLSEANLTDAVFSGQLLGVARCRH